MGFKCELCGKNEATAINKWLEQATQEGRV